VKRIQEFWQKGKNYAEDAVAEWGIVALVLLVGLACFGLGRLSALEEARPAVSVSQAAAAAGVESMQVGGAVVASKKGSVYHYPWCGGASTIAAQNKVWFASIEAAEVAGYRAAKNCKGLE